MERDWDHATLSTLQGFLSARGITSGALSTRPIGDGHSNLTLLVSDGERTVVVRRPPPPPIPPGANDMLREARILTALGDTWVPVPRVLATADEGDVLDVPLYVMTFTDGPVVTTATPARLAGERERIGFALIDTLADLHAVDFRAVGLGDLGRPEGFNARHLRRMRGLVTDSDGAIPEAFADIDAWLAQYVPAESGASIVHCDFRIGNVILAPEAPARIAAVLDWELATVGDPLLDVGNFLASVPEQGTEPNPTVELGAAMLEPGYPSRAELATRYSERTRRDLSDLAWYTTMALYKLAALYEYNRRRVLDGIGDPYYADHTLVQRFLRDARRSAGLLTVGDISRRHR